MSLGKRLIGAGAGVVCNTDSVQAFGVDNAFSSNIALYQLDGNANDTTGDYNGTATDVTYSTGQFGQAAVFNGSSSRIIVEDSTANAFGFANHIGAIGAWINVDSLSTNNVIAAKRDFGAPGNRHWIFNIETSGQIRFLIYNTDSNAQTVLSSSSISVNQWYHIAVTLTTSDVKIYINGVEDTTASSTYSTIQNGGADLQIGRRGTNSGYNYFDGKIDQLRIFNRGITPQEVSTLYNESTSTASNINPLSDGSGVALYTLDYDASDAGGLYDGTPTNVEFGVGGQINYGARFNGSVGGIEITNVNNLIQNEIESFSFWFKDRFILLFCDPSSATSTDRRRWLIDNNLASGIKMQVNNDQYNYENTSTNTQDGQWHHLAVSSDGYIYLDGTALSTQFSTSYWLGDGSNGSSRDTIRIGTGDYIGAMTNSSVIGSFDQFRIFNKALSSSEVSTLYAETACVYTCTTDTVDYPTTNLAYYKLNNSATDETGSYDGTETNVSYEFGRFGQAAVFNGSSSYIDTGISGATLGELFSVSVWFKTSTTSTFQTIFDNGGNTSGSTGFAIIIGTDNILKATFTNSGGGGGVDVFSLSTGATVTDGNWHHCVLTYNDESAKIYLDNNTPSTGTNTEPFTQAANALRIGAYYASGTSLNFNGDLDQIRVFTSELDSTQVTQLYEEKQCFDTVTEPTGNLRFDEFWAGYDDGQTNRAEFKSSGQIVDFNTNSEGHAVLNQNAQTSGKYYLEIQLVSTSGHDGFGVFNRSTNTVYDDSPYAAKNPIDSNYGATLYARGSIMYLGNVSQSGFTNLSLGNGDIVCMAVNVDEKRIWWGRRDGLSDSSVTWNSGNPNGGYGGLEVSFVPSDVIVSHVSESVSRFSEFEVLNHADMLEPPFNFSYLDGPNTASLTENESNF
jgi:hypothetical protein